MDGKRFSRRDRLRRLLHGGGVVPRHGLRAELRRPHPGNAVADEVGQMAPLRRVLVLRHRHRGRVLLRLLRDQGDILVEEAPYDISQGQDATPIWIPQMAMAIGVTVLAIALADHFIRMLFGGMPDIGEDTVEDHHTE